MYARYQFRLYCSWSQKRGQRTYIQFVPKGTVKYFKKYFFIQDTFENNNNTDWKNYDLFDL